MFHKFLCIPCSTALPTQNLYEVYLTYPPQLRITVPPIPSTGSNLDSNVHALKRTALDTLNVFPLCGMYCVANVHLCNSAIDIVIYKIMMSTHILLFTYHYTLWVYWWRKMIVLVNWCLSEGSFYDNHFRAFLPRCLRYIWNKGKTFFFNLLQWCVMGTHPSSLWLNGVLFTLLSMLENWKVLLTCLLYFVLLFMTHPAINPLPLPMAGG